MKFSDIRIGDMFAVDGGSPIVIVDLKEAPKNSGYFDMILIEELKVKRMSGCYPGQQWFRSYILIRNEI